MRARDRRAVFIGTVLILGAVTTTRGLPRIALAESESRARWEYAADRMRRLESSVLVKRPSRRDEVEEPDARLAFEAQFIESRTITEATGSLVQLVAGLADFAGARVRMTSPASDSAFRDGIATVRVRVSLSTDSQGLLTFLRELEVGPRLLVISQLTVSQVEPAAGPEQPEALRVELLILGLAREHARSAPTVSAGATI